MKKTLLILLALVAIVVIIYSYYGGFSSIKIDNQATQKEILVYQSLKGDYKQSADVMNTIYQTLIEKYGIETQKGFGIYYDNPQEVQKENLRSDVGCILNLTDSAKIVQLSSKFLIKEIPAKKYLTATFPYKGQLSIFIGICRVYPALHHYVIKNNIPPIGAVMEVYDVPNKQIHYRIVEH
ncbi:MAG: hypothetical protein GX273_03505 [Bacteroidales bacterium]|nr:hypothetical protein [Bacteroidales bacterium]